MHYSPDGYWRGPIWGAPTLILTEGLDAVGEHAFANEVRRRFCDMVATSGLAENYNALTGEGLRDRAFTWISSIFLVLAHELYLAETDSQ
jgi:putative isomerase